MAELKSRGLGRYFPGEAIAKIEMGKHHPDSFSERRSPVHSGSCLINIRLPETSRMNPAIKAGFRSLLGAAKAYMRQLLISALKIRLEDQRIVPDRIQDITRAEIVGSVTDVVEMVDVLDASQQ
jgi:hypothetical protein